VGSLLAEARSAAGMSVADVSAATRIRPAVVEAIERDDFTLCGGDAYAKGQLRSIARALGIDPEAVVAAFEGRSLGAADADEPAPRRSRRRAAPPAHPRVPPQLTVTATPEPSGADSQVGLARLTTSGGRGWSFNWTAAMLVAILALVTVGVVSVVTRGSSGGSPDEVLAPATSSAATTPSTPTTTPTPTPTTTDDTIAQATQVEVTVDVIGDKSWLSVTEGKATSLYEGLVVTGDSQTFVSDKKIRVVVGNAGAVTLTVDGQDLGVPGGTGEVVRLEFAPGEPALA
jgi:cytoskeletal protein RodZ